MILDPMHVRLSYFWETGSNSESESLVQSLGKMQKTLSRESCRKRITSKATRKKEDKQGNAI